MQVHTNDAEDYGHLKVMLEDKIQVGPALLGVRTRLRHSGFCSPQTLEQQLEEMKATYLLNTEVSLALGNHLQLILNLVCLDPIIAETRVQPQRAERARPGEQANAGAPTQTHSATA